MAHEAFAEQLKASRTDYKIAMLFGMFELPVVCS